MVSKYPGKLSYKKVADMTPYEHEQHKIYKNSSMTAYLDKRKHTESYKISRKARDKRYRERHPEKVRALSDRYRASVKADPVKSSKQLQVNRELDARYRSEMSKSYIKSLIGKNEGISMTIVTDEMVAAHRTTLTIKRLIKTMK
jgi:hypothetical protein